MTPAYDQAEAFSPGMQNSGGTADAVALFDVTADLIATDTVPVYAVIYGGMNTNGLLDETGAAGDVDVADVGSASAGMLSDGTWAAYATPTPTTCFFPDPA